MEKLIFAATASFGLGAFGYVLFRFFLLPIRRYRKLKSDILSVLIRAGEHPNLDSPERERIRKLADDIATCYHEELPVYYRLQLTRRKERPVEASQMLLAFSGMKNPEHIHRKATEIRNALDSSSRTGRHPS